MEGLPKEKYSIILADNNRQYLKILKEYVDRIPWLSLADIAFSGADLVEKLDECVPDILVMDLMLSYKDAIGVLEYVAERPEFCNMKKIVNSSVSRDYVVEKVFDAGADYILMKPSEFETFQNRIYDTLCQPTAVLNTTIKHNSRRERNEIPPAPEETLYQKASRLIQSTGMPAHMKGYQFLRYAIISVLEDPSLIHGVTTRLYPKIAQYFQTTADRVERNIRHAIEVTWTKGDMRSIDRLFGYTVDADKGKPTNAAFIATLADHLEIELLRVD